MKNDSKKPWTKHLVIFVVIVVHQLFSFLWYSPYLFAYKWIRAAEFRLALVPGYDKLEFYIPFVTSIFASLLLCYGLFALLTALRVTRIKKALLLGTVCWLAFSFPLALTHNEFANRPITLTLIDSIRDLILFLITSITLTWYINWGNKDADR